MESSYFHIECESMSYYVEYNNQLFPSQQCCEVLCCSGTNVHYPIQACLKITEARQSFQTTAKMKGAIVAKIGGEAEVVADLEKPKPDSSQVLVKSLVVAMNPVSVFFRRNNTSNTDR